MIDLALKNRFQVHHPRFFQSSDALREWVVGLLAKADVQVNGSRPWDMQVHDDALWQRIVAQGSLGLGEAYMDGLWDCEALDQFFDHVLLACLPSQIKLREMPFLTLLRARLFNPQSKKRSLEVAEIHYNLGNAFYAAMLDPHMQYTCGYFSSGAKNLEEAQEAKLHLICRKLDLKPGERVLELGSGWGGFARFAARNYGVEVIAYNISSEQVSWAREHSKGLPIEYRQQDYRDATGTFDKVVSVGMCEHVGPSNYRALFQLAHSCLDRGGLFLLHTIGNDESVSHNDPWLSKYIFPGSVLPSPAQLGSAMDNLFVLEDWHNFGVDYDQTLMAWNRRFEDAWPRFREEYGDRFYRMWRYYLLSCAGCFRSRYTQLYQIVASKGGLRGGWRTVR
jgi:cyclopropane-fatty-acyl-phospholipid synthase